MGGTAATILPGVLDAREAGGRPAQATPKRGAAHGEAEAEQMPVLLIRAVERRGHSQRAVGRRRGRLVPHSCAAVLLPTVR